MKHRSPIAVFFLSIITFGIYDLYWLVKTKSVLNQKTKYHTPTIWLLVLPVVVLVAAYIGLIAFASHSGSSTTTTNIYGTTTTSSTSTLKHPVEFFVSLGAIVVGWIAYLLISVFWLFRFSKAINQYTKGKMSTAVTFLILWVIHLIGVALVQDTFNDMQ